MRHSTCWSWLANRPFLASEIAVAHGYPMFGDGGIPISPTAALLRGQSASKLQSLVGNGFHIPSMAAWLVYVLAHCALKDFHVGILSLSDATEKDDDVDSSDEL